ncbi:armadillo repeat only 1 protein [Trifolium pratense]|uniref:Armadillo repeat only 1 protein n=1 Tax=Trifolium pratense TaxID=57577 RepID=A0A2K3MYY7_TRIPR|nr:armadillo repeat only 1 protein [Trifolium pratense]PNX96011.1 armadillo repeat only 1 protein [Trifolium pratense]
MMKSPKLEEERRLEEELLIPILMGEHVIKLAEEAKSSKVECRELAKKVEVLCNSLRGVVRVVSGNHQSLNERPIRRMVKELLKNLEKTLALVRRCKNQVGVGVLKHVLTIRSTGDFRKVWNLLESSNGDMMWLLSIFESRGTNIALSPITNNDPILAWVWTYIYTLQLGNPNDCADAATELGALAQITDRNRFIIMEEGGVLPLLKVLKDSAFPDCQVAAANALANVVSDDQQKIVGFLLNNLAVPVIVQVLSDAVFRVRVSVANLVSAMADQEPLAREEFIKANVTKPLVSLLSIDTVLAEPIAARNGIHSVVQNLSEADPDPDGSSGRGREADQSPELRNDVKVSCAKALWKLSKGCLLACKKITETKGLLCLAKIVGSESGELRLNCLMAVMEIAAVAESNVELRRGALKSTAPASKAVLNQLLRVIRQENDSSLLIPAIKSIGSLARNFPGKVPHVLGPLVTHLGNKDMNVVSEVIIALVKFVCVENYNCVDHSKVILELDGIPKLMILLKINGRQQVYGLKLLCYLTLNVGNSKVLEQERVLSTLDKLGHLVLAQNPDLKELFAKAIHHLTLYQPGVQFHRQPLVYGL